MKYIDTHCHLFSAEFDADRDEAVRRAISAGVHHLLLPNIDSESIAGMYALANAWPTHCHPMMGLHPCSVKENWQQEMERVGAELQSDRKFIGIGEIGLDYYWDTTFKEEQKDVFREQLRLAKSHKLPVAIHTRDSFDDALAIVQQEQDGSLRGVFHCFTGTAADAGKVIDAGLHLGIGGVATFKNGGLDKALPGLPLAWMILETDAPYLAPVPYRGKRNESAYIPLIAQRLGEIMQLQQEEIASTTTANAKRLFGLAE